MAQSLRRRLEQEESEWIEGNEVYRTHVVGRLRRAVLTLSSKLTATAWVLIVVAMGLCALTAFDERYWVIWRFRRFAIEDAVDYFGLLWTTQATIVALVYPLVISLVAILLQRRPGSATLTVYLHDSGALLAGLASVLLVGTMGLQYLFLPYLSDSRLAAWIVVDGSWFTLNVILLLHFLVRTFDFIRPNRRFEITKQYAIGIAWPAEAKRLLARHMFANAQSEGLFNPPIPTQSKPVIQVAFERWLPCEGSSIATSKGGPRRQIVDVRFDKLQRALQAWQRLSDKQAEPGDEAQPPVVYFPVAPLEDQPKHFDLCRAENAVTPSKFIVRQIASAFVLRKGPLNPPTSTQEIFDDLQSDALLALRAGDTEAFEKELERLTSLYVDLVRASRVLDAQGATATLTELQDGGLLSVGGNYIRWTRFYYSLIEGAARRLPLGDELLSLLARLPKTLFMKCHDEIPVRLSLHYFDMPTLAWDRLADWAVKDPTVTNPVTGVPTPSLSSPERALHLRAIHGFIDTWEPFARRAIEKINGPAPDWNAAAVWLHRHLSNTMQMMLTSSYRNDGEGAEWMADILIKWLGNLSHRLSQFQGYYWRQDLRFISVDSLSTSTSADTTEVHDDRDTPAMRFALAVKHAWVDTSVLSLCMLATWTEAESSSALMASLYAQLLKGEPLRPGGGQFHDRAVTSLGHVLTALIRMHDSNASYRERIGETARRIREIRHPRMVNERIYSSVGDDLGILGDGALLLMMTVPAANSMAERAVLTALEALLPSDPLAATHLIQLIGRWETRLASNPFVQRERTYELVRTRVDAPLNFADARTGLREQLNQALQSLEAARTQAVARQPIAQAALRRIETWCSDALRGDPPDFPLSLFENKGAGVEAGGEMNSIKFRYARGVLVEPPYENDAVNADEWFAAAIRQVVAAQVMGAVLSRLTLKSVRGATPVTYWNQFKKCVSKLKEQNLQPILVLDDHRQPPWMFDLAYPGDEKPASPPRGITLVHDNARGENGFQWTVNDVPVYAGSIPIGASILLPREVFREITFHPFANGQLVQASTRDLTDRPDEVEMTLSWRTSVRTEALDARRLTYRSQSRKS